MLTVRMAGCAFAVSVRASSGPSKQRCARSIPRDPLASSKTERASGTCSQKSRTMPTCCEPWPGNTSAILFIAWRPGSDSPSEQGRAPGEPPPESGQQEQIAALEPPGPYRFVQGNGNRGCRGVADAADVHHNPLPGQAEPLGDCIDDPRIGLVGNKEVDVRHLGAVRLQRCQ